jgi:hypothetical protein
VVSRRVVVSEKANTHARPLLRGPFTVQVPISHQTGAAWLSTIMLSCSHTSTFHYKLQGATNIHCDEVLTVPVPHLPIQNLVLYYPLPLTDFCTYEFTTVAVCDSSAHTSVTTVLMSVAIASIFEVFFMTKKERKVYNVKQGGEAAGGEEEREAGQL